MKIIYYILKYLSLLILIFDCALLTVKVFKLSDHKLVDLFLLLVNFYLPFFIGCFVITIAFCRIL